MNEVEHVAGPLSWLVVIDMQYAFGDPDCQWFAEGYSDIVPVVEKLVEKHGDRVVFTRFVRDPREAGHWSAYYDRWPTFRVGPDDPVWELTLDIAKDGLIIDEPTFSKWGQTLRDIVGNAPLVLCGVATECCVLATAFAVADSGRQVTVVSDACAGATRDLHAQALRILQANTPLITVTSASEL